MSATKPAKRKPRSKSATLTAKPRRLRHKGAKKPKTDIYGRKVKGKGGKLPLPALVAGIFAVGLSLGLGIGLISAPADKPAKPPVVAVNKPPPEFKPPAFMEEPQSPPAARSVAKKPPPPVPEPAPASVEVAEAPVSAHTPEPAPVETVVVPSAVARPYEELLTDAPIERGPTHFKDRIARKQKKLASLPDIVPLPYDGPGLPPWKRFAVPTEAPDGKPRIALVIDDMGLDRANTLKILQLDGPLTTAFLTYADDIDKQTNQAIELGHELLIHVAMEPTHKGIDAGPDVLLTSWSEKQIRSKLSEIFSRFHHYVGINNHMGSLFTANAKGMAVVLEEVKKRGLLFLDSRTNPETVGPDIAERFNVPSAARHVFIDNEASPDYVLGQLHELEGWAKRQGFAVGIGHPHSWTVEALKQWIPDAKKRGFEFVPISAIVKERMQLAANHGGG